MTNVTKNIISRASCKKNLMHSATAGLRLDAILLVLMLVLFIPLFCLGVYLAKTLFVLGFVFALCCLIAPGFFIYNLIRDIMTVLLIARDGFFIVKDTVSGKSKGEPQGRATVDVIYFSKYGRYIPSGTVFDLTSENDEFYLVILDKKKPELTAAYHSMMYDYKEND